MADQNITSHVVGSEEAGKRADQILAAVYSEVSRTLWAKLFDAQGVKLEGAAIRRNVKLKKGDVLEFVVPDLSRAPVEPVAMDLNIRFEDEHILVLVKPAGLVVHGGAGETGATLVAGLMHHCGANLSQIGGQERQGIVHRLDRETSGLMVVAKTDAAHEKLSQGFAERTIFKEYLALLQGVPDLLAGSWRGAIGRHDVHRHKMQVRQDGRESRTDWQHEQQWGKVASRVRCRLHTGRTHQIRVHWSDAGHPLLGDTTYGFSPQKWNVPIAVPRVMLHAARLGLPHPLSGEWLEWEEPLPQDMRRTEEALDALGNG